MILKDDTNEDRIPEIDASYPNHTEMDINELEYAYMGRQIDIDND